jgi:SAM-dependent methyltransferase
METVSLKGMTFRVDGMALESSAYLQKKLERIRRRNSRRRHPLGWLLHCLLPRDYWEVPIESMARGCVLVVGCGGGLETLGLGAIGIDIDRDSLGIANDLRAHAEDRRAFFLAASGTSLPFRSESFDSVLSDNVIEHISPSLVSDHLEETRRVLRPGGYYCFSTPNRIFEEPVKKGHVSLHSYEEWEVLATRAGFQELRTPRRRSGALVDLEWKKSRERAAAGARALGLSRQGIRTITIVAIR